MKSNSTNPSEDLQTIRKIMERSSRFLSLSGLSGIFAGACALTGAAIAWFFIPNPGQMSTGGYPSGFSLTTGTGLYLTLDSLAVLVVAISGAVYFSYKKARRAGEQIWNHTTRRLIVHMLIPLVSGGIFVLILAIRNDLELAASVMLIFYGLSLVNAAKFTFGEIHYLGLTEIILGIMAGFFTSYGLLFWTIGFGLMHLIYGTAMYYRHEH